MAVVGGDGAIVGDSERAMFYHLVVDAFDRMEKHDQTDAVYDLYPSSLSLSRRKTGRRERQGFPGPPGHRSAERESEPELGRELEEARREDQGLFWEEWWSRLIVEDGRGGVVFLDR
ncbi:hypothetical protein L249_1802 [Ophiocordyceps polyrhachis-furcata BCC 54312]|uniref:Uncharacterized protein n=1 Tax=Ophiocordyceps polyrhachis-furcata BCC 54312 TaxID=1330021 RepID=A0A367LRQ7_9HYPO|nr:hypothetical protein L249_1802 [Ophiocordyceps polyrhachis-furcata BCC 54312]